MEDPYTDGSGLYADQETEIYALPPPAKRGKKAKKEKEVKIDGIDDDDDGTYSIIETNKDRISKVVGNIKRLANFTDEQRKEFSYLVDQMKSSDPDVDQEKIKKRMIEITRNNRKYVPLIEEIYKKIHETKSLNGGFYTEKQKIKQLNKDFEKKRELYIKKGQIS